MDRAYFKEYFHLERTHWWFTAREDILKSLLKKFRHRSPQILNIGVATGRSTEWLSDFGTVTSIEYDPDCCNFVNETLNLNVMQGSITELPFENETFDLVCAFDVIEHVEDDHKAVSEMRRVCKPAGILYATVPAFMFLWSKHDEVNQHYRRYTKSQFNALFSEVGDSVYSSYFNSFLFLPIAAFRVLGSALGMSDKKREDAGSDFFVMHKGSLLQRLLFQLFRSEKYWLKTGLTFPFGVSILSAWRRGR